ncbi:hypothetical protein K1T71_005047 [Dendrolimus kikuchii]|uniref:Uncharacterized protein n=1 Tax=Dendrolimus kikuchii TaxID=765133 RepID=A0ACC1D6A1_9NEOP|nr:hypothetical protein K1T71_005047 [Dendrolimus kikuchii]
MLEDDEEEIFEGLYDDGHWEWSERARELLFVSNISKVENTFAVILPTFVGSLEFKDDLDLNQQQRFRKQVQRKPTEGDVVTLQDVKDVALFTASRTMLSPSLIDVLHFQVTQRFLRSLILYSQYYLQISDEMSRRLLDVKVLADKSGLVEAEFCENLEDLRLLVAKEYCNILLGIGEFSKYHHMGPKRRMSSLLKTDTLLFETFLRISIQIIWLTLGRKSFDQIEFEVHRLFKSPQFNIIDNKIRRRSIAKISLEERRVLLGHCVRRGKKVNTRSPLINEILCRRDIDYHILGLGVAQYAWLPARLRYFETVLTSPEKEFADLDISLGIIGLPRWRFDTVLKERNASILTTGPSASLKGSGTRSKKSMVSVLPKKMYNDICIPKKEPM